MSDAINNNSDSWREADADSAAKAKYLEEITRAIAGIKMQTTSYLQLRPGMSVLEAGCGLGHDTEIMARAVAPNGSAVGLDFSAEFVARASERTAALGLPLTFQRGDICNLPFPDGSFDAVRIERTLQHLPDPVRAVAEAVRVLRPGGRIAIMEPDWETAVVSGGDRNTERAVRRYKVDMTTANGAAGRDVPSWLAQSGCRDIGTEVMVFSFPSLAVADQVLSLAHSLEGAIDAGWVELDAGKAWWSALQERDKAGAFVGMIAGVITWATV